MLYTSSITQYGFAQNNSSSNRTSSSSGSGSQGNSSSGGSSSGQQNGIGIAAEMHNLTGAGTQQILSNNSKISNTGGLSKLGNESTTPQPSQGKPAPQSQPFPTQNQMLDNLVIRVYLDKMLDKAKTNLLSRGAGQQSSGGARQTKTNLQSRGAGQTILWWCWTNLVWTKPNQSQSVVLDKTNLLIWSGQSQNQSSIRGARQSKNQSSNPLDVLAKLFSGGK